MPVGVLAAVRGGSGEPDKTGCSVRYAAAPGGVRLTLSLEHPGSVEARLGGAVVARRHEPFGPSTLAVTGTGAPTATEFTDDGQLIECSVSPG